VEIDDHQADLGDSDADEWSDDEQYMAQDEAKYVKKYKKTSASEWQWLKRVLEFGNHGYVQ
jgi:hypothetical protein